MVWDKQDGALAEHDWTSAQESWHATPLEMRTAIFEVARELLAHNDVEGASVVLDLVPDSERIKFLDEQIFLPE